MDTMIEPLGDGISQNPATDNASSSRGLARVVMLAIVIGAIVIGWRWLGPRGALAHAGWGYDWDAAVVQSKSSGKPALVLFTADWCPACRQLESQVLSKSDVQQYLKENFTLLVVDLSKRSDAASGERARECGIRSIPTLVLYDVQGQERARTHGMPAEALVRWLRANR
jgi:thiol:disulfide interchange protein DsbD